MTSAQAALSQSKELVNTLRCQKEPQDSIEGGVSFAADDNVVDNLGSLGEIHQAAHNRPIPLLRTGVVLEVWPRAGEGDALVGGAVHYRKKQSCLPA